MSPRAHSPTVRSPETETIRRLEEKLWEARRTVIDLMPAEFQQIVRECYKCESREDLYAWRKRAVAYALKIAEPTEGYWERRAFCPLCRSGTSYESGYKYPIGLEMHLEGSGNTHRCSVMQVAWDYARDARAEVIEEQEKVTRAQEKATKAARLATEVLWKVDEDEPKLLDDIFLGFEKPRDPEALELALNRLEALGFRELRDGNVRSFTHEVDDHIVYADPRCQKRIDFRVFRKGAAHKKKRYGSSGQRFHLQDSWKKDLPKKFREKLDAAIASLR